MCILITTHHITALSCPGFALMTFAQCLVLCSIFFFILNILFYLHPKTLWSFAILSPCILVYGCDCNIIYFDLTKTLLVGFRH